MAAKRYLAGLRTLRIDRKMSQAVLASRLGVSVQAISRYENQLCFPRENLLQAACEVLACELWEMCHPSPIRAKNLIALAESLERAVS